MSLAKELRNSALSALPRSSARASDSVEHMLPKIYFVTRTHSQVAQFVKEASRLPGIGPTLRIVALGARKQLCINPDVRKLGSDQKINERCLELTRLEAWGKRGI